jgi:formylglycine-generating enzyme required for sulfatase activity
MNPKIFISYARNDVKTARRLYNDLEKAGADPWMDESDLKGGDDWQYLISKQIQESQFFLALLSSESLAKVGYVQAEVDMALDRQKRFPKGDNFFIPVRINDCDPEDDRVKKFHMVDLFPYKTGLKKLLQSLNLSADSPKLSPCLEWDDEIKQYCQKAKSLHEKIPLAGFKTRVRVPIKVEDIYVALRAMMDLRITGKSCFRDAEHAEECLQARGEGREISVPDAFVETGRRGRRGIVILGDPGSGKTTHLKRVLLWCLERGHQRLGLPDNMIPVFLPLRELRDLKKSLDDFIQLQLDQPHLETREGFGNRLLKRGCLLFLLDGLDEVAETGNRVKVSRWIEDALAAYPSCRFVVTCRFAGYTDEARLNEDFLEMHMRPLDEKQAEAFIHNWYRIVETWRCSDKNQALGIAKENAADLIARLRQPEFRARRMFEMTRNPLLLTNLCLVHLDRGNLPHTREKLYEECTEVLLERWRGAKNIPSKMTARIGRRVLQPAALWMHQEENRTRASAGELAPVIDPALKSVGWEYGTAGDFLEAVRDESGLLTGWDQKHYGFMHLGFQEYLTAREIRNIAFTNPSALRDIAGKFGQAWWQEVILLMLALEEPSLFTPFMREVVKVQGFAEHSGLMEMCLDEAAEKTVHPFIELLALDPGHNKELWERQYAALRVAERLNKEAVEKLAKTLRNHPHDPIRRRVAELAAADAQVMMTAPRGGYELVRIPGGTFMMGSPETEAGRYPDEVLHQVTLSDFYIGRYPVTNEEYGRFLAGNPDAKEPEEWSNRQFNQPRQPVVGVNWHKAKVYARWAGLTLPTEAQWEYACRAGTRTRYYTGDKEEDLDRAGWYSKNSGKATHPVGEKEPNGFGLYDMHGNVWEWCEDWCEYKESQIVTDTYQDGVVDPVCTTGSLRVIRGGSWAYGAGRCRTASRYWGGLASRYRDLGFRLVLLPGR